MTTVENRLHPRFAIELDAAITVAGKSAVTGRTRDISRGGFCMLADESVPIGAAGVVKLALVFSESEFSEHLTLPATAVWCTPLHGAYQIGVKFGALDEQSRGYLDLFMKFLDGEDDEDDDATE